MVKTKEVARRLVELEAVLEIMTFAIAREKATADYYARAEEKSVTESARKAFALLLEQERDHERLIRIELEKLRKEIAELRAGQSR